MFTAFFQRINEESKTQDDTDLIDGTNPLFDTTYEVLADHSGIISVFPNYDVSFSNGGRGYVLRRICRWAMRYAQGVFKQSWISSQISLGSIEGVRNFTSFRHIRHECI